MKFDVIIIGGGLAGITAAAKLQEAGRKVAVVAAGRSIHNVSYHGFEQKGGALLMGDAVVKADFDGNRIKCVYTGKLGAMPLEADSYVLASGKYFGGGIVADMDKVYEKVFGCDVKSLADRSEWFNPDFAAKQAFMEFGVATDADAHALKGGEAIVNLYACGEVLAGLSGVEEGADEAIKASAEKVASIIIG